VRACGTVAHIYRPRNEPLNIVVRQKSRNIVQFLRSRKVLKNYLFKTVLQFLLAANATLLSYTSYASESKCAVGKELLEAAKKTNPSAEPMEPASQNYNDAQPEKRVLRYVSISISEGDYFVKASKYAALVEVTRGQAWVYRYAGYDGSHSWFGPFQISPDQLSSCESAKSPYLNSMLNRR
jgi:hypothetical protein